MHHAPELIGIGKYSGEIADHMAGAGHNVTVVSAQPHYPEWAVRPPYRNRYQVETVNGVRTFRTPLVLKSPMRGVWRLIAPLSFALTASPLIVWRAFRDRPDVIVCVAPTLFIAPAVWLARVLTGAGTLLHIQDLEIDAAFVVGHLKPGFLQKSALAFERWIMRRFDRVVTISHRMAGRLEDKGVSTDRLQVIRNWVDTRVIRPMPGPNPYRRLLELADDAFVVLYAGAIGKKQALHVVLEAAKALEGDPAIRFVIAGEGPELPELKTRYAGLGNVQYLPLQPSERLSELLNLASLHVLPQDRQMADLVLPSKLGGVLASGRPLVVMADPGTELHTFLGEVAILVEPGDALALADAIRLASQADASLHVAGLALAERLDARQNLAAFETAIGEVAGSRPRRRSTDDRPQ